MMATGSQSLRQQGGDDSEEGRGVLRNGPQESVLASELQMKKRGGILPRTLLSQEA